MKVKVLIPFFDKHTGEKYTEGDIIDVTPDRFNEIIGTGNLIQTVEEEKEEPEYA